MSSSACVGALHQPDSPKAAPEVFYTVTAEIALARHETRLAALQYAAAAESAEDVALLRRAAEVTETCLQPSLTAVVATRWIELDPGSVDAQRALAKADLELDRIEQSALHYRAVLIGSSRGTSAELAALDTELAAADNSYAARQVADRLVQYFPSDPAALRVQAFAALRADDPAAAARTFQAALGGAAEAPQTGGDTAGRHELMVGYWRARILSGDAEEPLDEAKQLAARQASAENGLDYALLLLAAQHNAAARSQLLVLADEAASKPLALRLLGLLDLQEGDLADAGVRFAELAATGRYLDDALYYSGLVAERHDDPERALRLYAEVSNGDDVLPALLRAASLLKRNGAAPAAEQLVDQLIADEPQHAPQILAARARMDADAGDVAQAFAVLQNAELEYPDSAELRYAAAALSEEHGQTSVALRDLQAVAAARPRDPAALNAYGYTLADAKRHLATARKLIEQAHAAAPKNAAILDSLGWVLFRQGHGEQALPYLNAAYADDHDADVAAHLGEVLWSTGRRAAAEHTWAEAEKESPDNRLLKSTLTRLHAAK